VLNRHLSRGERDQLAKVERGARLRWPAVEPVSKGRILRAAGMPTIQA
jgi:hypothetical protein